MYGGEVITSINDINIDSVAIQPPLAFIKSGRYFYSSGVGDQELTGLLWEPSAAQNDKSDYFVFNNKLILIKTTGGKGYGFPIRCLVR